MFVTFDANKNVAKVKVNAETLAENTVSWTLKKIHGHRTCA